MSKPKRHFDWMPLCLLFLVVAGMNLIASREASAQQTPLNPNGFDTPEIIDALYTPHSDLVMISAHRGFHALAGLPQAKGVPENSLQSIIVAAEAGWEMIELDVKVTKDGVPILSHDKTWGKEWCGWGNFFADPNWGVPFNPFDLDETHYNWKKNPKIDGTLLSDTRSYWGNTLLRDTSIIAPPEEGKANTPGCDFHGRWKEYPPTLSDALDFIKDNKIRMVVMLDIQSIDIAQKSLGVVLGKTDDRGRAFLNSVVFKMPAALFPGGDSDLRTAFGDNWGNMHFLPVINTSNVAPVGQNITDTEDGGFDASNAGLTGFGGEAAISQWFAQLEAGNYYHIPALELNMKEPNGILNSVFQNAGRNTERGLTIGTFNPVGEYYEPGDPKPRFFRSSNGTCCDVLEQYLYNNPNGTGPIDPNQPVDHTDQRTDLNFQLNQGFRYLITDYPGAARNELLARGKRNICYMQPTQTANCASGGFDPTSSCLPDDPNCSDPYYFNAIDDGNRLSFAYVLPVGTEADYTMHLLISGGSGSTDYPWQCSAPLPIAKQYYPGGAIWEAGLEGHNKVALWTNPTPGQSSGGVGFLAALGIAQSQGWACTQLTGNLIAPIDGGGNISQFPNNVFFPIDDSNGTTGTGGGSGGGLPTQPPGQQPGDTYNFPADSSATFTVNAGATSFTATQPNDSVATYVWQDGGAPKEWLTSANGSDLGAKLEYVPVKNYAGVSPSATITVNAGTTYQTIDGFGGALTDSAAYLIQNSPNRNAIMNNLFGTGTDGAGLTIVRSPMGSSDLMADPNDLHTYEDTPGQFGVQAYASDNRQITMLQQAKSIAGSNFKLLGTPWSAPGWMKRGGSLLPAQCGTSLNEFDTANASHYASYFVNYVNAYTALGIRPWMVSMQNEPENCQTSMPTTNFNAMDEVALAQNIKQQMPSDVKLLGWDHNWNDENFVNTLTNYNVVNAVGYHCYDGTDYAHQTQSVATYFTECSGFLNQQNVTTNLGWEVANNIMGPLRYGSRGSLYWSLAQDANGNPHYGGAAACQNCRGMMTVNSDGSYSPSQDYYYWAQFSKFVAPGAVRVDSNNVGNLSTIAFHEGSTNVLVVLNSASSQANGGSPGSTEDDLTRTIVQWNNDTSSQPASWLVGTDGYRRWIGDSSTFNCLKYDAGMQGPVAVASGALDKYINLQDSWAVCGSITMGTNSELETNTYLKSKNGARLTLGPNGLATIDSANNPRWAPSGNGNRLILQSDGNLVLYAGGSASWSSNTSGSGAAYLSVYDDGSFALTDKQNTKVWVSQLDPGWYKGKMVEYEGDTSPQKPSWQVGLDMKRRYVPDLATFQCLHDSGEGNVYSVTDSMLNLMPNLQNVWATCGGTQIGAQGSLEKGAKLVAGNYSLILQPDGNLVLYNGTAAVWATATNGKGGSQLTLQSDGNLVLYDQNYNSIWATGTNGTSPGWLILGADGSLKLFDASNILRWQR